MSGIRLTHGGVLCACVVLMASLVLAHGGVPDSIVFEPDTSSSSSSSNSSPRFAANDTNVNSNNTTTTTAPVVANITTPAETAAPVPQQPVDPDSLLLLSFLTPSATNNWRDNIDFHVPQGYSVFDATRYQIDVLRGRRFSTERMIGWLQAQKRHLEQRIVQLSGNMTLEQRRVAQRAREYFSAAQTGVKCAAAVVATPAVPTNAAAPVFLEADNSTTNTSSSATTNSNTTVITSSNTTIASNTTAPVVTPAPTTAPSSPLCEYLHNAARLLREARLRLSNLQLHHKRLVRLWKRAAPYIIDQLLILERRRADQIRLINHYITIAANLPLSR